jgi:hypothetical protein
MVIRQTSTHESGSGSALDSTAGNHASPFIDDFEQDCGLRSDGSFLYY